MAVLHVAGSTSDPKGTWHADPSVLGHERRTPTSAHPRRRLPRGVPSGASAGSACSAWRSLHRGCGSCSSRRSTLKTRPTGSSPRARCIGSALPFFHRVPRRTARPQSPEALAGSAPASAAGRPSRGAAQEIEECSRTSASWSWSSPSCRSPRAAPSTTPTNSSRGAGARWGRALTIRVVGLDGVECPPGKVSCNCGARRCSSATRNAALERDTHDNDAHSRRQPGCRRRHRARLHHGQGKEHHPQRGEHRRQRDRGCAAPGQDDQHRRHRRADPRTGAHACAIVQLVDGVARYRWPTFAEHCPRAGPGQAEGPRAARVRRRGAPQRHGEDRQALSCAAFA